MKCSTTVSGGREIRLEGIRLVLFLIIGFSDLKCRECRRVWHRNVGRTVWFRAQDNPSMRSQKFDYRRKTLIRSLYKLQPSARHAQPPANGSCGRRKPPRPLPDAHRSHSAERGRPQSVYGGQISSFPAAEVVATGKAVKCRMSAEMIYCPQI